MLKYQQKLSEFEIENLDNENLDPAFVSKAKDLQEKISKDLLTDQEVQKADKELCDLFDELHDFEEVPSEEYSEIQKAKIALEGKNGVHEADSIDVLELIVKKYAAYPEVVELSNAKIEKLKAKQAEEQEKEKAVSSVQELVNSATSLDHLKELTANLDDKDPLVVGIVNAKIKELKEAEKQAAQEKQQTIQQKLLSQSAWSYDQLKEMGITPTGEDMVAHNVELAKAYLFKAYRVVGVVK